MGLNWLGDQVSQQISAKLASGLNRFDEQIAVRARQKLYPGHGYLTGRLQTSTTHRQVRLEGNRLVGSVGSFGIWYGMYISRRYDYIVQSMEELRANAVEIITKG